MLFGNIFAYLYTIFAEQLSKDKKLVCVIQIVLNINFFYGRKCKIYFQIKKIIMSIFEKKKRKRVAKFPEVVENTRYEKGVNARIERIMIAKNRNPEVRGTRQATIKEIFHKGLVETEKVLKIA